MGFCLNKNLLDVEISSLRHFGSQSSTCATTINAKNDMSVTNFFVCDEKWFLENLVKTLVTILSREGKRKLGPIKPCREDFKICFYCFNLSELSMEI